jgi:cell division protein FtsL
MTVVCIAFVVVAVLCATRYYDVRQRRERLLEESRQLQAQKQALLDQNDALIAQGAHSNDDVYVEKVAREQLDMVYPGEIIFRVSGD